MRLLNIEAGRKDDIACEVMRNEALMRKSRRARKNTIILTQMFVLQIKGITTDTALGCASDFALAENVPSFDSAARNF